MRVYLCIVRDTTPGMDGAIVDILRVRATGHTSARRKAQAWLNTDIGDPAYVIDEVIAQTRITDVP